MGRTTDLAQTRTRTDAGPPQTPRVIEAIRASADLFDRALRLTDSQTTGDQFVTYAEAMVLEDLNRRDHGPRLLECEPATVISALLTAAQHGLHPGPVEEVHIHPRQYGERVVAEFRAHISVLRTWALAHPDIEHIGTFRTHLADTTTFSYGSHLHASMIPSAGPEKARGPLQYVVAIAYLTGGHTPFVATHVDDLTRWRETHVPRDTDSPWWTDDGFPKMCEHRVLRSLLRHLPKTPALQRLLRSEFTVRTNDDPTVEAARAATRLSRAGAPLDDGATATEHPAEENSGTEPPER